MSDHDNQCEVMLRPYDAPPICHCWYRAEIERLRCELARALEAVESRDATLAALRVEEQPAYLRLERELAEAEAQRDQMREAILWALGERDEFPTREPGQGAYWWRTELRRRAFLAADSAPAVCPECLGTGMGGTGGICRCKCGTSSASVTDVTTADKSSDG